MARVTEAEVKLIIDTQLTNIDLFIDTANIIVDEDLSDVGMSDVRLNKIELYLSAHFVCLREKQLTSENFGSASETYQGKTGMNLQSTNYGQTAMMLDKSGTLVNVGKTRSRFSLL